MVFFSFGHLLALLTRYEYFLVFPLAVVEGPIVTVLAGFLAATSVFEFSSAYVTVVVADLVGDCAYYAAGRWGARRFIGRWGRYIHLRDERMGLLTAHFERHSTKTLALGKLAQGVGPVVLVTAGVIRMPLGRFILVSLVLTVPKSLLFILIGYYFGHAYTRINSYVNSVGLFTVLAVVLVLFMYGVPRLLRQYFSPAA
jgi:membrane protein DedA with SNARE-associated domain